MTYCVCVCFALLLAAACCCHSDYDALVPLIITVGITNARLGQYDLYVANKPLGFTAPPAPTTVTAYADYYGYEGELRWDAETVSIEHAQFILNVLTCDEESVRREFMENLLTTTSNLLSDASVMHLTHHGLWESCDDECHKEAFRLYGFVVSSDTDRRDQPFVSRRRGRNMAAMQQVQQQQSATSAEVEGITQLLSGSAFFLSAAGAPDRANTGMFNYTGSMRMSADGNKENIAPDTSAPFPNLASTTLFSPRYTQYPISVSAGLVPGSAPSTVLGVPVSSVLAMPPPAPLSVLGVSSPPAQVTINHNYMTSVAPTTHQALASIGLGIVAGLQSMQAGGAFAPVAAHVEGQGDNEKDDGASQHKKQRVE